MWETRRPLVLAALGAFQLALWLGPPAARGQAERPPPASEPAASAAPAPLPAGMGLVCFDAAAWLNPCHKGAQALFDRECPAGPPKGKKPAAPRFKLGKGPWHELSPTRWRCVQVPLGLRLLVAIQDQAEHTRVAPDCPTRRVDVSYSDFYGGMSAHCSRRKRVQNDEILTDYSYDAPAPAETAPAK